MKIKSIQKSLLSIFILLLGLLFVSCKDAQDNTPPFLTIAQKTVNFSSESATSDVVVKSSADSWTPNVKPDAQSWLSAKKAGSKLSITVTQNSGSETRKGEISIFAGQLSETVTVEQLGREPAILVSPEIYTMADDGGEFLLEITSNIEYEVTIPDADTWLKQLAAPRSSDMVKKEFTFKALRNEVDKERQTNIIVKQKNGNLEKKVLIIQKAQAGYGGSNGSSVKDDVKVPVARGVASSTQPNGTSGIERSFDNDFSTQYHSAWDNSAANYFPITLEYFFENQESIDYFIYHPRQDANSNGRFKQVEIWVSTESEPNYRKSLEVDMKGSSTPTRMTFDKKLIKPKSVKFVVKSGAGDRQGFASCIEMEFYRNNPDNFDPQSVFADIACTKLKPGVTKEQIDNIPNALFRNIAYYMLKNEYPREFRIATYKAYPHPDDWASVNKTSTLSLLDNPTGISIAENEEVVVIVGETGGNVLGMKIQNLDLPGGDGYNNASVYPLSKGVNKIKARNKGLAYIFYHTSNYKSAPEVAIHFATGKVNGYFDSQKHQASDWSRLLNAASDKYFDVVGKYAHLTFETGHFKTYAANNGDKLIDAYDELMRLQMDFMGLYKYNRVPANRAYFHAMYHSYFYSTAYRTAYNITGKGEQNALMNVEQMKKSPWGPAHEQGHTFQTRPGFLWHGMTEVTNNVHSLYVQTQWGNKSRIENEDMGRFNNRYEKAYYNSFVKGVSYPGEGDVFCKLVSLWQLQRYFGDAKGTDFYKDLYEEVRKTPAKPSPGEQQLDFTRMASKIAKTDLTDFFAKWGYYQTFEQEIDDYGKRVVKVTQAQIDKTLAEIKAMGLPKPTDKIEYISDSNWETYKNGASVQQGTAAISGKTVTMTGWKNVAAYEVYEGDELIFVSNKDSFELDNNATAKTKVFAVSYNGNKTEVKF